MVTRSQGRVTIVEMKSFGIRALLVWVMLALCGCGMEASDKLPGLYVAEKSIPMRDIADGDALFVINGQSLLKSEYNSRLRIAERIFRIKKGLKDGYYTKELNQHLERSKRFILERMLTAELLRQGAERANVEPTVADLKEAYGNFSKSMGKGKWNEREVVKRFGLVDGVYLARMITNDATSIAFRRQSTTNLIDVVTDEEIDAYLRKIERFNKRSLKNNEKSRARALKVRDEIISGRVKFDDASDRWAQVSPEHGHEWGVFRLSEFDEGSAIRTWLASAKAGDISDPVDLDDGLALVGVISVDPADLPKDLPPEDDYTLVKCTFYAYRNAEKMSREEAWEYLRAEKRESAQIDLGHRLYDSAVIEMPNGNEFFPTKKKRKVVQR